MKPLKFSKKLNRKSFDFTPSDAGSKVYFSNLGVEFLSINNFLTTLKNESDKVSLYSCFMFNKLSIKTVN